MQLGDTSAICLIGSWRNPYSTPLHPIRCLFARRTAWLEKSRSQGLHYVLECICSSSNPSTILFVCYSCRGHIFRLQILHSAPTVIRRLSTVDPDFELGYYCLICFRSIASSLTTRLEALYCSYSLLKFDRTASSCCLEVGLDCFFA